MFSEDPSAEIGENIGDPRADEDENVNIAPDRAYVTQTDNARKGNGDVHRRHKDDADVGGANLVDLKDMNEHEVHKIHNGNAQKHAVCRRKAGAGEKRSRRGVKQRRNREKQMLSQPDTAEHFVYAEKAAYRRRDIKDGRTRKNEDRDKDQQKYDGGENPLFHKTSAHSPPKRRRVLPNL